MIKHLNTHFSLHVVAVQQLLQAQTLDVDSCDSQLMELIPSHPSTLQREQEILTNTSLKLGTCF